MSTFASTKADCMEEQSCSLPCLVLLCPCTDAGLNVYAAKRVTDLSLHTIQLCVSWYYTSSPLLTVHKGQVLSDVRGCIWCMNMQVVHTCEYCDHCNIRLKGLVRAIALRISSSCYQPS